ncbi:neutral/alkaline non-lysosomal ceramidase N-terminal domain-containing protein, partial [Infirmifilum sp.]
GYIRRKEPSQGVHDDIFVKVLLLESGGLRVLITSFDLLGVDENLYASAKSRVASSREVFIAVGTHTHSAPASLFKSPLLTFGDEVFDKLYFDYVLDSLEHAVLEAEEKLSQASVSLYTAKVKGVATDRDDPAREINDKSTLLVFSSRNGDKCGLLHFGVHPTVLGPENLLISRDLVGYATDYIEEKLGVKTCLFVNGEAGNVSTRFVRKGQNFSEAQRLGVLLARQTIGSAPIFTTKEARAEDISVEQHQVDLRLKHPSEKLSEVSFFSEVGREKTDRRSEAAMEGKELLEKLSGLKAWPRNVQAIIVRLTLKGILHSIWLPFEVSSGLFEARASTSLPTLIVSYANGYYAYLAPEATKSYEYIFELVSKQDKVRIRGQIQAMINDRSLKDN